MVADRASEPGFAPQMLVMLVIVCNTAVLAMYHTGQTIEWIQAYEMLEIIFSIVFSLGMTKQRSCACCIEQCFALASLALALCVN